jgi:hypothetical protein
LSGRNGWQGGFVVQGFGGGEQEQHFLIIGLV